MIVISLSVVFPAGAGVIPEGTLKYDATNGVSRRRGGDPLPYPFFVGVIVFPAGAGVIRWGNALHPAFIGVSRRRGGDPQSQKKRGS